MDYSQHTHCPNCFKPSQAVVCPSCSFNRNIYLQQEAASHHLPLFTVLDKGYVLGRVLGEGSFAIVYAATRLKDQLPCAVKEYYPHDLAQRGLDGKTVNPKRNQEQLAIWQNRFIQEAELLRCCYDYPSVESGVVRYMAMIKQHGTAYLVMERLNGYNLAHYLPPNKTLSGESICLWLKPLLETLQKLHAKEIYHRDISPNNIFLCAPNYPVLMDFGLAREGVRDEVLKSSTLGAGTFIAPEQLTGGYCDQRADLYALGAVIYLCLHGEAPPPVEARRQGAPLKQISQSSPVNIALQNVANHCLQLNLQDRPANTAQLLTELSPYWPTPGSQNSFVRYAYSNEIRENFRTIIPDQDHPILSQSEHPRINLPSNEQILPPADPLLTPAWQSSDFIKAAFKLALWGGIAYAGFIGYQHYADEQEKIAKEERRQFAKSVTIADFKNYLEQCQICEEKQTALDKIAQLELDKQQKEERQKKKRQEHLLYIQAQSPDDLKSYLATCELCLDKDKAEKELKDMLAEQDRRKRDELAAEERKKSEAAGNQPDLLDTVADAVTKPIIDTTNKVLDDVKKQAELELKRQTDALAKAKAEEEAKARAAAEEKAKAEAELQAELEAEAKAREEAEAKAKAERDAKTKAEVEKAIKDSTGIDVQEIQKWIDSHSQ